MHEEEQLAALPELHDLLDGRGIEYWVFGGWAVDFHAAPSAARTPLVAEKSEVRDDPAVAAKDHADVEALSSSREGGGVSRADRPGRH